MIEGMQELDDKYLERHANAYSLMASMPNDARFSIHVYGTAETASECGTAACIAGHAGLHPWFRRRKFALYVGRENSAPYAPLSLVTRHSQNPTQEAMQFFGIKRSEWLPEWEMHNNGGNLDGHPFDPEFYEDYQYYFDFDFDDPENPTVQDAAQALRGYMEFHWGVDKTLKAIGNAEAKYNVEDVHKNTTRWQCKKES